MNEVMIAGVLALFSTIVTTIGAVAIARLSKGVKDVHEEVRTNNGRSSGSYVVNLDKKITTLARMMNQQHREQMAETKAVFELLVIHTDDPLAHRDSGPLGDGDFDPEEQVVRIPSREGAG